MAVITSNNGKVTIDGKDVVTQISVDPAQQIISKGPNQGQTYYRARHDGIGFIVNEEFRAAWEDGNVIEVNLIPRPYQVEDALNPGQMIDRQGFQLTTWATFDQVAKIEVSQSKLELGRKRHTIEVRKLDLEMEVAEKKALAEFQLSDEKVAALKEA